MKKISLKEIWTYYLTVFITGTAVLIVEIAAIRQLTPIFGGSIYVISSVLSVILLALSVGYFFGGRLADNFPTHKILYYVITVSGLSLLFLQLASTTLLSGLAFQSLIIGPLLVALLFFFIPAVLLGMDSPYVIKLITHNSSEKDSGKYVGTTFFWSTIGSIFGSLLAGFWLIPNIGVQASITYTAIALVTLGLLAPVWLSTESFTKYFSKSYIYIAITVALTAILFQQINSIDIYDENILFEADGLYSRILVEKTEFNNRPAISLWRDLNNSSAIFINSYDNVFDYSQFVDIYDELIDEPSNFLAIGGGAYSTPRRLVAVDPAINVDVVEIEPVLFELAQTYFDLSDTSRIENFTVDARIFLDQTENKYDFIFSDAFNTSHTMPWQLGTMEFYQDIKSVLRPEGVLMINYIGVIDPSPDSMTSIFLNTLQQSFPHVELYGSQTLNRKELQNLIFIASESPLKTESISDFEINTRQHGTLALEELRVETDIFSVPGRDVFTDNKAPIEYLMGKQVRKYLDTI